MSVAGKGCKVETLCLLLSKRMMLLEGNTWTTFVQPHAVLQRHDGRKRVAWGFFLTLVYHLSQKVKKYCPQRPIYSTVILKPCSVRQKRLTCKKVNYYTDGRKRVTGPMGKVHWRSIISG